MQVLVVNAGSSSLKLRLLGADNSVIREHDMVVAEAGIDTVALAACLRTWPAPDVVGHRIVHGGTRFTSPVRIDAAVEQELRKFVDLAPLHQPKSLAAYDAVSALLPDVPAVACFDTAFHAALPAAAATYAVPREWRERYGVRRYGFHGLSHAYASRRAADMIGKPLKTLRIVTCHLGAGASLAAVVGGRSVDTTMGFTPLEGLVMATRSGSVDPGLVLWLQEHEHLTTDEVATALERRSGLLALTGTADMREVERHAQAGDGAARLGFEVFVHRLVTSIGAMTAAAGGLDALVFTGGIGEHSPGVRRAACERLAHLGARIDSEANARARDDADIGQSQAGVRVLVVAAREDLEIENETRAVISAA
ncbi:MAG TPA: acetate/propionate family kinase [Gammaproteobacteria bacterium]|nr:acetate/propionate family kinase [Gammaproteobacteria bacterium]